MNNNQISITALSRKFGPHSASVLAGAGYVRGLPYAKGKVRMFNVDRELPTPEQVRELVNKRFTYTVVGLIESFYSESNMLRDELQAWYDNLPESFQNGEKGEALTQAIDALQWSDTTPDMPEEEMADWRAVSVPRPDASSRLARMQNAIGDAQVAVDFIEKWLEAHKSDAGTVTGASPNELRSDLEQLVETIREAIEEAENVEFPAMY